MVLFLSEKGLANYHTLFYLFYTLEHFFEWQQQQITLSSHLHLCFININSHPTQTALCSPASPQSAESIMPLFSQAALFTSDQRGWAQRGGCLSEGVFHPCITGPLACSSVSSVSLFVHGFVGKKNVTLGCQVCKYTMKHRNTTTGVNVKCWKR